MDSDTGGGHAASTGGGGSMAGDMPSLKSLLQVWHLHADHSRLHFKTGLCDVFQLKKKYDAPDPEDLPDGYKVNSNKERLYLWAAKNFQEQIKHKYPTLEPLCLTCKNECETEKLVMTFIKASFTIFCTLKNKIYQMSCAISAVRIALLPPFWSKWVFKVCQWLSVLPGNKKELLLVMLLLLCSDDLYLLL